jgi:C-terminal processing protease CtpA/Prc
MLSFQRNGKTLDGNGTRPDIILERDEEQVLRKKDSQLEKLIELIKN